MHFDKKRRDVHNMFQVSKDLLKQYDDETLYIKTHSQKKPILIRFVKSIKYKTDEPHETLNVHDVCDLLIDRWCCFNSVTITYRLCEDVYIDKFKIQESSKYNLVLMRVKYISKTKLPIST